ncbi:MAG: SRPBCC family protein [Kiritimatiellae bacterium]|nr:SRPBCC family protein [Kiritimatiellia bacterium]
MQVLNVHEREITAAAGVVGALVDSLASDKDRLWPKGWPAMRFDRPLSVGAVGGHGPISYTVEEYRPGQMVRFRFLGPRGFDGHHWFEVLRRGEHCTLLRHTIQMRAHGPALLSWPIAIRPLHDALLEDALALAQASVGATPVVQPWSRWVRVLRWLMSGGRTRRQATPKPAIEGTDGKLRLQVPSASDSRNPSL